MARTFGGALAAVRGAVPVRGCRRWAVPAIIAADIVAAALAVVLILSAGSGDDRPTGPGSSAPEVESVRVGGLPTGMAFARGSAYVSRARSQRLARIDLASFEAAESYRVPARATAITAGFGALWVTSARPAQVTRIDLDAGRSTSTRLPHGLPVAVVAGPRRVWVGLRRERRGEGYPPGVAPIDPRTQRVGGRVSVPAGVQDMAAGPQALWVTSRTAPRVTRIGRRTGRLSPRPVPGRPRAWWPASGRCG